MKPTDVTRFHNDLKAAIIAGVPVEIGERSGSPASRLTLAKLGRLESASEPDRPSRYRAALRTFDQIGSMPPVLDGLTAGSIARKQISRVMRSAFVYMIVLLAVACCGLYVFKTKVLPHVDNLRADISLAAGVAAPERLDEMFWLTVFLAVLGCSLVLFVLWMLVGGASKVAMWMGGHHYVRCRTSTTAIRTLQLLLGAGLPVEDAVSVSCDLTGADENVRHDINTAVRDPQNAQHLKSLSDYLMISANQRLAYMKVAAPTTLICSVGGVVVMVYCVVIFWPVITILQELTTVGI